jgi:hypothetical protein
MNRTSIDSKYGKKRFIKTVNTAGHPMLRPPERQQLAIHIPRYENIDRKKGRRGEGKKGKRDVEREA